MPAVVQDLLLLPRSLVRVDADHWRWRVGWHPPPAGIARLTSRQVSDMEEQASTQVLGGLTRQQQPQRQAPQVRLKAQCWATSPQAA